MAWLATVVVLMISFVRLVSCGSSSASRVCRRVEVEGSDFGAEQLRVLLLATALLHSHCAVFDRERHIWSGASHESPVNCLVGSCLLSGDFP